MVPDNHKSGAAAPEMPAFTDTRKLFKNYNTNMKCKELYGGYQFTGGAISCV